MKRYFYFSKLIIAIIMLVGKSNTIFAAAPPEEPREIPLFIQQKLIATELTAEPLPAVTQWLLERYRQLPIPSRIFAGHNGAVLAAGPADINMKNNTFIIYT